MSYLGNMKKIIKNMKNIKKVLPVLFFSAVVFFFSLSGPIFAADVNLTVRDGNTIVFSGAVPLPIAGSINLNDSDGNPHSLDNHSVLSVLNDADQTDGTWSVSNLQYFSSFGSFYLKCLTDSLGSQCDNWQYAVNGSYPFTSMDQNILSGDENIYLFFGSQHRVLLDSNSTTTVSTLTVTAEDYDYQNNKWIKRTGVIVGLTQTNPANPFSPTEIKTQTVDANGQATFSSITAGSYNIGVKEDFYFPTETLVVTLAPGSAGCCAVASIPEAQNQIIKPESSLVKLTFDHKKAFEFLIAEQKKDGSFGEDIYTDWSAIAFSSRDGYEVNKDALKKYFIHNKTSGTLLTDYERRAMALMASGLDPYSTNGENYIEKISSSFDGKQFGDKNEDNDDIFGLIVLQSAGFSPAEKMISDDISFILSKQKVNGSFDESVDMTGAAIGALSFSQDTKDANKNKDVKDALQKAKDFLKQNQKNTGGWANVSSTAWAIEGILGFGEKPEDWVKSDKNPLGYLTENQDTDGGIKGESIKNRIWETAYAITAISGKTWNQIMVEFNKPPIKVNTQATQIKVAKITPKNKINNKMQRLENLAVQNTATALTAVADTPAKNTQPIKKPGILSRFLSIIFSFFY